MKTKENLKALIVPFLLFAAQLHSQEQINMTTFYPAPQGVYFTLRSTSNTALATAGGTVAVGTITPGAGVLLSVAGGMALGTGAAAANQNARITSPSATAGNAQFLFRNGNNGDPALRLTAANGTPLLLDSLPASLVGNTSMVINRTGGNLGIGTAGAPQSAFHVANGVFAQFENHGVNNPGGANCSADSQYGRVYLRDQGGNQDLYLCFGTSGWRRISSVAALP